MSALRNATAKISVEVTACGLTRNEMQESIISALIDLDRPATGTVRVAPEHWKGTPLTVDLLDEADNTARVQWEHDGATGDYQTWLQATYPTLAAKRGGATK